MDSGFGKIVLSKRESGRDVFPVIRYNPPMNATGGNAHATNW